VREFTDKHLPVVYLQGGIRTGTLPQHTRLEDDRLAFLSVLVLPGTTGSFKRAFSSPRGLTETMRVTGGDLQMPRPAFMPVRGSHDLQAVPSQYEALNSLLPFPTTMEPACSNQILK